MVEQPHHTLDVVFHALADPTRRSMLRSLAEGQRTISQLAAPYDISFAAASKHVRVLERAGLLRRRVRGRTHICQLEPQPLAIADRWLRYYEQLWTTQLDALAALFEADDHDVSGDAPPATGSDGSLP
jgi:DNA-binding transcriptional ArsR family regulator